MSGPPAPPLTAASGLEPLLDLAEIQGNILAGFSKDHQALLALKIRDLATARRWLQRILPEINSTREVLHFNELFRLRRKRLGHDPAGLIATWANIAFSHAGLARLASPQEADSLPDEAFQVGLNGARAAGLGDPVAPGENDPTKDWVVGGTNRPVDILLIVASDHPRELAAAVKRLRPKAGDGKGAPKVVWRENGATRADLPGHEHFGFKDGVSQPGVRGLTSQQSAIFLTPRLLEPSAAGEVEFSKPGQPLVWPGQFVLGYPATDGSSNSGGGPLDSDKDLPDLAKNGSFLVFRRLRQDVAGFHTFLGEQARAVSANPSFSIMTPERLGALIVGRWPSGAPVPRAPASDLKALAEDDLSNNDFLFTTDTPAPALRPMVPPPQGSFAAAREDSAGFICPHAAHIRKVNPRDQDSDKGDQFDTLTRRIIRRGIPYGLPLQNFAIDDKVDRGLHFLSYQASIVNQFEVLQQDWANSTENPKPGGHDLIIGQPGQSGPAGARVLKLISNTGGSQEVISTLPYVIPTGGGYFFAPSLTVLRKLAGLLAKEPGATGARSQDRATPRASTGDARTHRGELSQPGSP
jgi:Dyp-type peroxidase family